MDREPDRSQARKGRSLVRSWKRIPGIVTCLALMALCALSVGARRATATPPELEIEAPPSLQRRAAEVRAFDLDRLEVALQLTGLTDPGPPIRVVLAPEDSDQARAAPAWVAGYALSSVDTVVLFPARAPSYPDRSLESLLHHEVAHVLIDRAARGRPVPRWFHEGVAMAAGRAWSLEDMTRFAFERVRGEPVPLAELETWFRGDASRVHRAYSVAGAFVQDLLSEHGRQVTGDILAGLGEGLSFGEAFQRATGVPLVVAQARFLAKFSGFARWVPFLTSSVVLWIAVTGLALIAIWRRRRRDAVLYESWEHEERWTRGDRRALSGPNDPDADGSGDGNGDGNGDGSGWVH